MSPHSGNMLKIVRMGEIVLMYHVCTVARLRMWAFKTNLFLGHDNKCEFFFRTSCIFRQMISKDGLAVDPSKIEAIVNWQSPKNMVEVKSFLGLIGYYKRFVEGLTQLVRKNVPFVWTHQREYSF